MRLGGVYRSGGSPDTRHTLRRYLTDLNLIPQAAIPIQLSRQYYPFQTIRNGFENIMITRRFTSLLLALLLVGSVTSCAFDDRGKYPLHDAAERGDLEKISDLLNAGASINQTDGPHGFTPLHKAALEGRVSAAELLIDRGAEVDVRRSLGATPLHDAAFRGEASVVKLLIEKGADVNARDVQGSTPLHWATYTGDVSCGELLIGRGADVNAKNRYDATPLHRAVEFGHIDFTKLLIESGAELSAENSDNKSPADIAVLMDRDYVSDLLRKHGSISIEKPPSHNTSYISVVPTVLFLFFFFSLVFAILCAKQSFRCSTMVRILTTLIAFVGCLVVLYYMTLGLDSWMLWRGG